MFEMNSPQAATSKSIHVIYTKREPLFKKKSHTNIKNTEKERKQPEVI